MLGPNFSPREAAIDALYRFLDALDSNNAQLAHSAFTATAIVDRSGLSAATGFPFPIVQGIKDIKEQILGTVGRMDTGHHVSNVRAKLDEREERADVTCYVMAHHKRAGEGPDPRKSMHLTMGSRYEAAIAKDKAERNGLWRIEKIELKCLWSEGDLRVFMPQ